MATQAGGKSLAWSGSGNSYRFLERSSKGDWIRIERDNLLHPRVLPEGVHIAEVSFDSRRPNPC